MASATTEMKRVSTYDQLAAKDVEGGGQQIAGIVGKKTPCNISWSNIDFTVTNGKAGKPPITVLDKVWGSAKAGEVVCVMGSSGAGKSSLLNVLAGRSTSGGNVKISGSVTVNGREINPQAWRSNVAYVMQDDALMMTATPREALSFSASLRLPQSITQEEIKLLVDKTITDLALETCADTMIGGPLMKGISGGQRKRTSVGVEIITNPTLLFLDEPTSGLDSFSAYNCIALLKRMAVEQNTTVLCTIHQPASEVFFQFDKCIFMKGGRIFYQGPTQDIVQHYSKLGEACPLNYNPSDFIMALSQRLSMEEVEKRGMMMDCPADFKHEGPSATWTLVTDAKEGEETSVQAAELGGAVEVFNHGGAGFLKQLYFLCERELQNICRDYGALIGRYGVTIFLNLLFGIIFLNSGGQDDSIRTNANGHFGSLTMVTIASMFGCAQPVMLLFPFERPLFLREYSTSTYSGGAYFLSKTICELPLTFVQSLVQYIICYYMCNFQGNFIYMVLAAWALGAASASVATCLGSAVPDVKTVTELAPLLFVPQLLFAGFFVQTSKIPEVLRWAQWLCGIKYGMNLLILTEFNPALKSCQGGAAQFCHSIIDDNDIKEDAWWTYIIILVALFLAFRILGAIILIDRAKTFY